MSPLPPVCVVVLLAVVGIAAVSDLMYRRVPNWLVLTGLLLGFGVNVTLYGLPGAFFALKGMGIAFLIYFPLYLLRAFGAGDVKLMAAIGSLAGPADWFAIFLLTGILGGIIAVVMMAARHRLMKTFQNAGLIVRSLALRQAPYAVNPELDVRNPDAVGLPHAAVIALGTLVFLAASMFTAPQS